MQDMLLAWCTIWQLVLSFKIILNTVFSHLSIINKLRTYISSWLNIKVSMFLRIFFISSRLFILLALEVGVIIQYVGCIPFGPCAHQEWLLSADLGVTSEHCWVLPKHKQKRNCYIPLCFYVICCDSFNCGFSFNFLFSEPSYIFCSFYLFREK